MALPPEIVQQMKKAGLPQSGPHPFVPRIKINSRGKPEIDKRFPGRGPRRRKKGWVDSQGRIWIKDRAHAHLPDHWDVQINDGEEHIRVGLDGSEI